MTEDIPFYLVNYNDDTRLNNIIRRFESIGINFKLLPPVSYEDERIKQANFDKRICHITVQHLDKMKDFIYNTNFEHCIICEDDVLPSKYLKEDLLKIVQEFDKLNLDILLLGYLINFSIINESFKLIDRSYSYHNYSDQLWGTQMYIINRKHAKFLLNKYTIEWANNNLDKPYAADWTITKEGKRAILNPMLAVEEGDIKANCSGQSNYHQNCFKFNFNDNFIF